MPQPKQYESSAERVAAFRARKRQEKLEREEAERQAQAEARKAERERQEARTRIRQAIGTMLDRWSQGGELGNPGYLALESGLERSEHRAVAEYMREIAAVLKEGSPYLPR